MNTDGFSKEVELFGERVLRVNNRVYQGAGWSAVFSASPGLMIQGYGWYGDQQFYCRSRSGSWDLRVGANEGDVWDDEPVDTEDSYDWQDDDYREGAELEALERVLWWFRSGRDQGTLERYRLALKDAGFEIRRGLLEAMTQEELVALAIHTDNLNEGLVFQVEPGEFATGMVEMLAVLQSKSS